MTLFGIPLDELELNRIGQWPFAIRFCLLLCFCCLTMGIGSLMILNSSWILLKERYQEAVTLQEALKQTYHQASNIDEYQKHLAQIKYSIDFLNQQLPSKKEEAKLLEDISQYAATSNLQLLGIKPHPESQKEFYIEHPIEISLLGDFHGFGKFTSLLSNMARIIVTRDFSINQDKGSTHLRIIVTACVYSSLRSKEENKE